MDELMTAIDINTTKVGSGKLSAVNEESSPNDLLESWMVEGVTDDMTIAQAVEEIDFNLGKRNWDMGANILYSIGGKTYTDIRGDDSGLWDEVYDNNRRY
jgi:hypothetical protein